MKLNPEQRAKFCEAMGRTLQAYESLINNTEEERDGWHAFGCTHTCRICKALDVSVIESGACQSCPLFPCWRDDSFDEMDNALNGLCDLREAALMRYRWLIEKLAEGGYTVKLSPAGKQIINKPAHDLG